MKTRENKDVLKAIPIGGHGEIGKNSWVFECKNELIIVNYGFMLPPLDLTGVDLVLPNISYIKENEDKIKGLIITSAHDDSAGGLFYLLKKVKIPKIWGAKLAIETIKHTLPENTPMPESEVFIPREEFKVGSSFTVKPIQNTSVLPDTYGLFIQTPVGNIVYTGSFKIDGTPPDKVLLDYFSYAESGELGVDLLISDSANIENPGYSQSESTVTKRFNEILRDSNSRIIIVSYASSLHKFQIILNLAKKYNKKVLLSGKYLINKINAAIKAGFIKVDKSLLIDKKDLNQVKDNEYVAIVSGAYGNFLSALIEMAKEKHEDIKLKSQDTVVISAEAPPGTVRTIAHTIDQLFVQKVQVIGGKDQGINVPEHASQEEAKFMLTVTKPRAFIPSHGEERQFVLYELFAETIGISPNDIHIIKNGDIVELREGIARVAGKVPAESIYYNQAKDLDIDEVTMKERQALSEEGTITIALTVNSERNIVAGPEILAEGCAFAKGKDWRAFCLGTIELIKEAIKIRKEEEKEVLELQAIKSLVRDTVNKNVLEFIGRRPLINVAIQEIQMSKKS